MAMIAVQPSGDSVAVSVPDRVTVPNVAEIENHGRNSRSITSSSAKPPNIQSSLETDSRFT